MNSLLLVIPYHKKDAVLAKQLVNWMAELQPYGYLQPCILACDASVDRETQKEIFELAQVAFSSVDLLRIPVPLDRQGWIPGSNFMFEKVAQTIQECVKLPWFWCEPDCVPLRESWLDALGEMYAIQAKRFMGAWVDSKQAGLPNRYLEGCAIYDPHAYDGIKQFTSSTTVGFPIGAAGYTVMRSTNTPLIQHFWGKPDLAPTFRETKGENDPENTIPMGYLRPDAAIFHRVKDGTLIDLLRARKNAEIPKRRGPGRPRKEESELVPEPML